MSARGERGVDAITARLARTTLSSAPDRIEVYCDQVGSIIGSGGSLLKQLEQVHGVKVNIPRDSKDKEWPAKSVITVLGRDVPGALRSIQLLLKSQAHMSALFQGKPPPPTLKKLYVDANNFVSNHFFTSDDWSVAHAVQRVADFVRAAARCHVSIKVFFDASRVSAEALEKRDRRALAGVTKGERNTPQSAASMVAGAFSRLGVPVCFSAEADNDDTLAAHAFADGAAVLSADQDFFRYLGPRRGVALFDVFNDFNVDGTGNLLLQKAVAGKKFIEPRLIAVPPPAFSTVRFDYDLGSPPEFWGGVPSPLIKSVGNPHCVVAPLRACVYAKMGLIQAVRERIVGWSATSKRAEFVITLVSPNNAAEKWVAGDPEAAFAHYFPKEAAPTGKEASVDWARHVMGCFALVLELHCNYLHLTSGAAEGDFLTGMERWEGSRPDLVEWLVRDGGAE